MLKAQALDIMTLLAVPGVGQSRVRKLLSFGCQAREDACNSDSVIQSAHMVLNAQQMKALPEAQKIAQDEWERLRDFGAEVIGLGDERYPQSLLTRLRETAPLLLICKGNLNLLYKSSVGFCGSRAASEKGINTAWESATLLAEHSVNVVSGFAAGVDIKAHLGALIAGGTTTIVLAEGFLRFKVKREIREAWDETRVLVLSEFGANQPWSVGHAMQRNRTICALSEALILIEARSSGGSIEAGRECLRMGLPLFAAVYEGMPEAADGNDFLLRNGAKVLMKSKTTNKPNIARILAATNSAAPSTRN